MKSLCAFTALQVVQVIQPIASKTGCIESGREFDFNSRDIKKQESESIRRMKDLMAKEINQNCF